MYKFHVVFREILGHLLETNEVKSEGEDHNEENAKSENVIQNQYYSKHKQFKNYNLSEEDEKKRELRACSEYRNNIKGWVFDLTIYSIRFKETENLPHYLIFLFLYLWNLQRDKN